MAELSSTLIVRGENIQTLYNSYVNQAFVVNRRYQRKLVWAISEKAAFIDSLRKQLPVPLVLTAERTLNGTTTLEIIDGLQRLNSIFSFIENQYAIDGQYFDLETLAETKLRRDEGILVQQEPILDRRECVSIANYVLPMSTYRAPDEALVEEVFRRINSNGRYLSRQEIRQAGAISNFADLVRDVSSFVRGDISVRDLIQLTNMPSISITSDSTGPGVYIEDVFWVRNKILERDQVRESRDEEIVADLLATMILDSVPRYASDTLDEYYGLKPGDSKESRRDRIETAVQREGGELIRSRFEHVHNVLETILKKSGKSFSQLVFRSPRQRVPRYYATIFLALYTLLIRENRVVSDEWALIRVLDGIGDRVFNITAGGGTWSAENKRENIAAVAGVLRDLTVPAMGQRDVLLEANETRIHRLLRAALAEHSLFELKQGLHSLDANAEFDSRGFQRIMKALSAIANDGQEAVGYVIIGIADNKKDADRVKQLHGSTPVRDQDFWITGVDHEFGAHGSSLDGYMSFFGEKVRSSALDPDLLSQVLRDMRPANYHGKTVLLLTIRSAGHPVSYLDKWYERQGSSTIEVPTRDVGRLFKRFS
ncbi:DUF262 domain-containing protein [Actinomadura viridis]|uniref:GmrSD restriction endonucleases N-terminal domain-containing protein n=1 Tax=Actinomadura viridis TaxID=58110 RepID=A0A931GST4_9ACTN|nr:DUF262 domain-containing protein [Actinomadura viridis]MBG6091204.1 hypothetical protein [Actinomadura viridis]